ncbi:MAG: hypothetical protein AB1938_16580 [Myxococcota bacterium]
MRVGIGCIGLACAEAGGGAGAGAGFAGEGTGAGPGDAAGGICPVRPVRFGSGGGTEPTPDTVAGRVGDDCGGGAA